MSWFSRKKIPHPDGLDSTYYTPGVVFDGGAEHLAYRNDRPHPILNTFMGFIPQRQYSVKEPQSIYQYNALPVLTFFAGIVPGQLTTQELLESGQLQGSDNNTLANNSLFGGVQG